MNKSHPLALGIAIGVLWAAYVFIAGITAMYGWGTELVTVLGSLYLGYAASFVGAVVGAIWAFADGFIAGVVIAWIYNAVLTGSFAVTEHPGVTSHPSKA